MYDELFEQIEPMIKGILRARRLRVESVEDFIQEVRVRIFKYGLTKGVSDIEAVAHHVMWAHKSYKPKKRKLTQHQIPDNMDLSEDDAGIKNVDIKDEVENLVALTRLDFFTNEERIVFDLMRDGDKTIQQMGGTFNPPVSRQYIWQIQKSLKRKIRELKWT